MDSKPNKKIIKIGIVVIVLLLILTVVYLIRNSKGLIDSDSRNQQKESIFSEKNKETLNIYDYGYKDGGEVPELSELIDSDKKDMSDLTHQRMEEEIKKALKSFDFVEANKIESNYIAEYKVKENPLYIKRQGFYLDIGTLAYFEGSQDGYLEDKINAIKNLQTDEGMLYALMSLGLRDKSKILISADSVIPYEDEGITIIKKGNNKNGISSDVLSKIDSSQYSYDKLTYIDFEDTDANELRAIFIHSEDKVIPFVIMQTNGNNLKSISEWNDIYNDIYGVN